MGGPIHLADNLFETTPSSRLQTGITIFRRIIPGFRKLHFLFVRSIDRNGFYSAFNSTLINGKGRYYGGPSNVSLAVVNVKEGLRWVLYLFGVCAPLMYRVALATDSAWFPSPATLILPSLLMATI